MRFEPHKSLLCSDVTLLMRLEPHKFLLCCDVTLRMRFEPRSRGKSRSLFMNLSSLLGNQCLTKSSKIAISLLKINLFKSLSVSTRRSKDFGGNPAVCSKVFDPYVTEIHIGPNHRKSHFTFEDLSVQEPVGFRWQFCFLEKQSMRCLKVLGGNPEICSRIIDSYVVEIHAVKPNCLNSLLYSEDSCIQEPVHSRCRCSIPEKQSTV
ncbi:hypothetical protein AVEN_257897-1 [Araneus ventricosus]|uniref:Uncharacterized protein n=1 Tax=Araneus ventricosus TaxID=182803 RepID=A0A4Y2Q6P3_ARAVE|nr:hypothetical protein AVEN_257897-1 [Araneus ventricosus]